MLHNIYQSILYSLLYNAIYFLEHTSVNVCPCENSINQFVFDKGHISYLYRTFINIFICIIYR